MVKKNVPTPERRLKTIESILENIGRVARDNDAKIEIARVEGNLYGDRLEKIAADVKKVRDEIDRARDELYREIEEASIFDEEGGSPPQTPRDLESEGGSEEAQPPRLTPEGRAAVSFLVSKFVATCEALGLDLEDEKLGEVRDLRARGRLTNERHRLDAIDEAFEKLKKAYDAFGSTWLSETLEQDFAEETMDVEETEIVTDVDTFVRDRLLDLVSPTVEDVVRLDTREKTREFAKYLDNTKLNHLYFLNILLLSPFAASLGVFSRFVAWTKTSVATTLPTAAARRYHRDVTLKKRLTTDVIDRKNVPHADTTRSVHFPLFGFGIAFFPSEKLTISHSHIAIARAVSVDKKERPNMAINTMTNLPTLSTSSPMTLVTASPPHGSA